MKRIFKRFKSGNKSAATVAEKVSSDTSGDFSFDDVLDVETDEEREAREAREAAAEKEAFEAARAEAEARERAKAEKSADEEKILSAVRDAAKTSPKDARKPRIMIAGEFSAGKTHLINGLLGDKVLPSNVTATALPPIWLVWGRKAMMAVDLEGNTRTLDTLEEVGVDDTHYVVMSHPAPLLKDFSIIDTPGNSDPNIPSESWERMLEFADGVVWCTNATQAWRQSEKSVWNEMPARLLEKATIVITHADRMTDARSADRVQRRVKREAGKYFDTFLMASLLKDADVTRIREHLEELTDEMEARSGAVCGLVARFTSDHEMTAEEEQAAIKDAIARKEAQVKAALRVADGKKPAPEKAEDTSARSSSDTAEATTAEEQDAPGADAKEVVTPKRFGRPTGTKSQKAARAAEPRKAPADKVEKDRDDKAAQDSDDRIAPAADAVPSAEVHLFVPPTSGGGSEEGTARALWERLSADLDETDAKAVLACVDQLLETLDLGGEAPNTPILDARENSKASAGPSHSAMSRRKS